MSTWSIDLCQTWDRVGQLQGDSYEFHGVERFNEVGEWTLTFPDAAVSWSEYTNSGGVVVPYTPRDVDTLRLVEDGIVRYSGYVGELSQGSGGVERLLDVSGLRWKMSGPDLWDVLRTRVAFADPTQVNPSNWAATNDVNTGVASTVLASYLNDNLGSTALTDRVVAGFSVTDGLVGMSGTWSARLQPVYELARRILDDAELTIRFTVTSAGAVVAAIRQPRDLSETIVLSDQADLISVRSRFIPARSTWIVAGGDGTGTGRTFRTADSGAVGADRRERFVDVSSLNQTSEVQATAATNVRLDADTWVVTAEVADAVTDAVGFGRSVFVGDKVSVESAGDRFTLPVNAIGWHLDADRQVVRPTLGDGIPDALKGLIKDVANLAARFDNRIA